jgi:starvation-inducible DNA-binding protein
VARGTARIAAQASRLAEFPHDRCEGLKAVALLADRYATLGGSTRAAIDTAVKEGDADTADLLTGVSRGLDKALWFLEAHLA